MPGLIKRVIGGLLTLSCVLKYVLASSVNLLHEKSERLTSAHPYPKPILRNSKDLSLSTLNSGTKADPVKPDPEVDNFPFLRSDPDSDKSKLENQAEPRSALPLPSPSSWAKGEPIEVRRKSGRGRSSVSFNPMPTTPTNQKQPSKPQKPPHAPEITTGQPKLRPNLKPTEGPLQVGVKEPGRQPTEPEGKEFHIFTKLCFIMVIAFICLEVCCACFTCH